MQKVSITLKIIIISKTKRNSFTFQNELERLKCFSLFYFILNISVTLTLEFLIQSYHVIQYLI